MTTIAHEHFAVADLSVAAQMAKIKAANPQAVILWTTGSGFGTLLHGVNDAQIDVPIVGASSNLNFTQMAQYKTFVPKRLYFSGLRAMQPGTVANGPVKNAQDVYFAAFKGIGVRPDLGYNLAWDPALIVVDALRHVGADAGPDKVRDYIVGLHSWAGIDGVYDFRDGSQRGIGQNAVVMMSWNADRSDFTIASKPGGKLLK